MVCCWAAVQLFLLIQKGIIVEFEAGKYINEARLLLSEGKLSAPNLWFYSIQIGLLAIAIKTKTGFISIYLLQLLVNGAATIVFYKLCRKFANKEASFIATLLLIFNLPLQEFNVYLQTESIYISLTLFYAYMLLSTPVFNARVCVWIVLYLGVLGITRPNGLMLIPATLIFIYVRTVQNYSWRLRSIIAAIALILFLFVINVALGSGGEWRFMLAFQKELVLCAGTPYFTDIKISSNPHSIQGFIYYITNNFAHFFRLAVLKTIAFWGLYRSYFSAYHNLFLVLYFYPIFLLMILSILTWLKKNKKVFAYFAANILLAWLVVILTCDDVHNRFFLVLSPFVYILSLPMLEKICIKLKVTND